MGTVTFGPGRWTSSTLKDWSGHSAFVADVNCDWKSRKYWSSLVNELRLADSIVHVLIGQRRRDVPPGRRTRAMARLINTSNWWCRAIQRRATAHRDYSAILEMMVMASRPHHGGPVTTNGAYSFTSSTRISDDAVTRVTPLGATKSDHYQLCRANPFIQRKQAAAVFPCPGLQGRDAGVSRVDTFDGLRISGGTYSSTYASAGAKADHSDSRVLGFRHMAVTDLQIPVFVAHHDLPVRTFLPWGWWRPNPGNGLISRSNPPRRPTRINSQCERGGERDTASNTSGQPYRVLGACRSVASSFDLDCSLIPPVRRHTIRRFRQRTRG